jgi:hypothetical protein
MWGSVHNRKAVHAHVARYVRLLRFDKYSARQLMAGIQCGGGGSMGDTACRDPCIRLPGASVNDFAWLYKGPVACSPAEHAVRTRLAQTWVLWLFNGVVEPCLKAHFYVTDTALYRNRLFYFRKPVWRRLERLELARVAGSGQYTALATLPAAQQAEVRARTLGAAVLRFLPKAGSMRFLVNLSHRPAAAGGFPGASINMQLQNLFAVLKFERTRQPARMGASVFGYDDVHLKLRSFALRHRGSAQLDPYPTPVRLDGSPLMERERERERERGIPRGQVMIVADNWRGGG